MSTPTFTLNSPQLLTQTSDVCLDQHLQKDISVFQKHDGESACGFGH